MRMRFALRRGRPDAAEIAARVAEVRAEKRARGDRPHPACPHLAFARRIGLARTPATGGDWPTPAARDLYEQHLPLARRAARDRAARLPALADEFESAALEALWRCAVRYVPGGPADFPTFLWDRLRGALIDACRRNRPAGYSPRGDMASWPKVRPLSDSPDARGHVAALATPPAPDAAASEDALAAALGVLPPAYRAVLLARYRDGLSVAEAGRLLGVSPSRASRVQLDALARLRRDPRAVARLSGEPVPRRPAGIGGGA